MKDHAHVSRLLRSEKGSAIYSFLGFLIIAIVVVGTAIWFPWDKAFKPAKDNDLAGAQAAMDKKDWKTAVVVYTKILQEKPGKGDALIGRSAAYVQMGEVDKAAQDVEQAVAKNPGNAKAFGQRALIRKLQLKYDLAKKDIEQALKLDPKYAWAYAQRADLLSRQDDQGKALADVNKALAIKPNFGEALRLKAWILSRSGKCKEAAEEFAKLQKQSPNDPMTIQDVAWFYMTCPDEKLQDSAKALDLAKKAFEASDGREAVVFETLAEASFRNGDPLKASELQKKAIALAGKKCPDGSCTKGMAERQQKYELASRQEVRTYEILPLDAGR